MTETERKRLQAYVGWMKNNGVTCLEIPDVKIVIEPVLLGTPYTDVEAGSAQEPHGSSQDPEPELPIMEDPLTYGSTSPSMVPRIKRSNGN